MCVRRFILCQGLCLALAKHTARKKRLCMVKQCIRPTTLALGSRQKNNYWSELGPMDKMASSGVMG